MYASRIGLLDGFKLAINRKNNNDVLSCWNDVIFNFFWRCFVSLFNFSYWSKFHVNIMTGMIIFENNSVWVLPNIRRLGLFKGTKFGMNVYIEMLLNVAKSQGYSFYRFWVIKGKPTVTVGSGLRLRPCPAKPIYFQTIYFYVMSY